VVIHICQKSKKGARPGIDGLRYEHVHQLVGNTVEAQDYEYQLVSKLGEILSIIASGAAPEEVYTFLRNNEVVAIPKANNDVRPIGMGCTYRKLASKYLLMQMRTFNEKHFQNLQFAMKKNGMEEIVHSIKFTMELNPTLHLYSIDACNAFNNGNRLTCLQQIAENFPKALPFLSNMYGFSSSGFFYGMEEGIQKISSEIGFHQGDVLANWCYIMSIQPLLVEIQDMLRVKHPNEYHLIKFYVDDGYFVASFDAMQDIIQILDSENTVTKYGFIINKKKGGYLMGKCNSNQESQRQRKILTEQYGLDPGIIKINPVDIQCSSSENPRSTYGTKVLGSFIGDDEYITSQLLQFVHELENIGNELVSYPDLQGRFLLFCHSFAKKHIYLLRTISPSLVKDFISNVERIHKRILSSINETTPDEVPEEFYEIATLPINEGGLGIHRSKKWPLVHSLLQF
jgi:hypothetical protein